MPNHDDENLIITDEDEKSGPILIDDAYVAEWLKDPEVAREYEALGPKYDRLERQIRARKARRARRKAFVKRVRGLWARIKQPLRG